MKRSSRSFSPLFCCSTRCFKRKQTTLPTRKYITTTHQIGKYNRSKMRAEKYRTHIDNGDNIYMVVLTWNKQKITLTYITSQRSYDQTRTGSQKQIYQVRIDHEDHKRVSCHIIQSCSSCFITFMKMIALTSQMQYITQHLGLQVKTSVKKLKHLMDVAAM